MGQLCYYWMVGACEEGLETPPAIKASSLWVGTPEVTSSLEGVSFIPPASPLLVLRTEPSLEWVVNSKKLKYQTERTYYEIVWRKVRATCKPIFANFGKNSAKNGEWGFDCKNEGNGHLKLGTRKHNFLLQLWLLLIKTSAALLNSNLTVREDFQVKILPVGLWAFSWPVGCLCDSQEKPAVMSLWTEKVNESLVWVRTQSTLEFGQRLCIWFFKEILKKRIQNHKRNQSFHRYQYTSVWQY
jgi:hypothetical protein